MVPTFRHHDCGKKSPLLFWPKLTISGLSVIFFYVTGLDVKELPIWIDAEAFFYQSNNLCTFLQIAIIEASLKQ